MSWKFWMFILPVCVATYWGYIHKDAVENVILFADKEECIETFETVFSAEQLQNQHAKSLLLSPQHTWNQARLFFSPHTLLNVKYSAANKSTVASSMLFDMIDGELVLQTNTFQHTQGFADCLQSKANAEDFRILHFITKHGGNVSLEQMSLDLGMEESALNRRIDSLKKRHLIVVSHEMVRMHVESPLLQVEPSSLINKPLVQRKTPRKTLLPETYSLAAIQRLIANAFGSTIAIRTAKTVYVPVYELQIQNPDGSVRKTYWNAISGQQLWANSSPPTTTE